MCRGKNCCSELNQDTTKWDIYCPLRQPIWMNEQINIFVDSVNDLIGWNRDACLFKLNSIRDKEIQTWYIEHGQMSGWHRNNKLKIPSPKIVDTEKRDVLRAPKKYQNEVFMRDKYICQYCGGRLISQKFLQTFTKKINSDIFKRGNTNVDTHGIIHLTWPVADHVIPWNLWGRTDLSNLVACCATCNYWKAGYTIEQLGLENPFNKNKNYKTDWDGLNSKLDALKKLT